MKVSRMPQEVQDTVDSPSSDPTTHRMTNQQRNDRWLRQLRVLGVGLPALFIVLLQVARPFLFDRLWPQYGDEIVSGLTALAAIAFGLTMFRLIDQLVEDDRLRSTIAERDRIARELHDSLAQVLGATHLRLQALKAHPAVAGEPDVCGELTDIAGTCHEAYRDVREAILGLKIGPQADLTLVEGLRSYAEKFARQSGIETTVVADGDPLLSPTREVQVIRVVQEALTNVRKHSGARHARITVVQEGEWVSVAVEDDGTGFAVERPAATDGGFGLHSMRERAELVGGRVVIDSRPGEGACVRVVVPSGDRTPRLAAPAVPA